MDHANDIGQLVDSADQVILGVEAGANPSIANARLIVAAPEMYELLTHVQGWPSDLRESITALLARIDGKETP